MTGRVASIWRYPIKSHSRERIDRITLAEGQALPWDRVWAVAHTESKADGSEWVPCAHFSRGSKAAGLGAISSSLDEASGLITLTHPSLGSLTFHPDQQPERLIDWAGPLIPANRAPSHRLIRAAERGFTDSDFPSVTLCSAASHRAVERQIGTDLSPHRWRGNIWFDGIEAWSEFEWIGRDIRIGDAVLRPRERTDRCLATHNNPETGERDHDILSALEAFGHQDFSVRAIVVQGGQVSVGDTVEPA